jgi:hypothetical protein
MSFNTGTPNFVYFIDVYTPYIVLVRENITIFCVLSSVLGNKKWRILRELLKIRISDCLEGGQFGLEQVEAGEPASRPWTFETILISMLLEQEKALVELRSKIRGYEEKEGRCI